MTRRPRLTVAGWSVTSSSPSQVRNPCNLYDAKSLLTILACRRGGKSHLSIIDRKFRDSYRLDCSILISAPCRNSSTGDTRSSSSLMHTRVALEFDISPMGLKCTMCHSWSSSGRLLCLPFSRFFRSSGISSLENRFK